MKTFTSLADSEVTRLLQDGAVAVIPTDTVYGLVCAASNAEAVERLYALKHREHKPGTIIAASVDQLVELGLKRRYLLPVSQYWPGSVSVIIPCGAELEYLHLGVGGLAVRIPADKQLHSLLNATGPLLTTSANLPGEPIADTIHDARQYFDDRVDFYADGGNMAGKPPSTIIRVVDDAIEVIRQGAVIISE